MVCCTMLDYAMLWDNIYGMVWYGMVWYGMVWYGMVWYGMVWYGRDNADSLALQICRLVVLCLITF